MDWLKPPKCFITNSVGFRSLEYLFGERGWYEYTVKPNVTCQLKTIKSPENSYMREWTYKHMSNYTLVSFF